jgi:hypothetical protein
MQIFAPVYRFGPALFIPIMVVGSALYSPWQHYGSWPAYLILLGLPVAICWHLALIVTERPRTTYFGYAAANLIFYILIGIYCLFWVTGDSL